MSKLSRPVVLALAALSSVASTTGAPSLHPPDRRSREATTVLAAARFDTPAIPGDLHSLRGSAASPELASDAPRRRASPVDSLISSDAPSSDPSSLPSAAPSDVPTHDPSSSPSITPISVCRRRDGDGGYTLIKTAQPRDGDVLFHFELGKLTEVPGMDDGNFFNEGCAPMRCFTYSGPPEDSDVTNQCDQAGENCCRGDDACSHFVGTLCVDATLGSCNGFWACASAGTFGHRPLFVYPGSCMGTEEEGSSQCEAASGIIRSGSCSDGAYACAYADAVIPKGFCNSEGACDSATQDTIDRGGATAAEEEESPCDEMCECAGPLAFEYEVCP